jgi:AcrR family transcriptional regulator
MKSRKKQAHGVGTIYNFFKTKADIFINVVAEEVGAGEQEYPLEDAGVEKNVRDIVLSFSWRSLGKRRYLGKKNLERVACGHVQFEKAGWRII